QARMGWRVPRRGRGPHRQLRGGRRLRARRRVRRRLRRARLAYSPPLQEPVAPKRAHDHRERRRKRRGAMTITTISVLICTYNRARLLRETLAAMQAQRPPGCAVEIIVVDNNSTRSEEHTSELQSLRHLV